MSGQWSAFRLTAEGKPSMAVALAILGLYAAATLYVGWHHEPWRDEADSWLVVRDAPITTIFSWTRNAGTPALWYMTLKPLVWLGLPYQSQLILHLVFAWAAAAVFLLASPFPWITKLLVLSSYYLAYEYAVIARSYVLTILLAFVIAAWYPQRHARPIPYAIAIALLFNANVHGALIAAILTFLFVLDRARATPAVPLAIMAAGAIAAWAQLRTAPDAAAPNIVRGIDRSAVWQSLGNAFSPGRPLVMSAVAAIILILLISVSLRRRRDALLFLLLSFASLMIVYVFIWFGGYRHAGLLLICALVAIWIARDVPRNVISSTAAVLMNVLLAFSVLFSFRMARADVRWAYSGSREMGEFIRSSGLDRYEIAAHKFQQAEAVLPWIPGKKLWYAALGRYGTYMLWNRDDETGLHMQYPLAVSRAVDHFAPQNKPWLLLLNAPLPPSEPGFRLIYTNRRPVYRRQDERYWLYEWTGR